MIKNLIFTIAIIFGVFCMAFLSILSLVLVTDWTNSIILGYASSAAITLLTVASIVYTVLFYEGK